MTVRKRTIHILPSSFKFSSFNLTIEQRELEFRKNEWEVATYKTTPQWATIIERWKERYNKDAWIYTDWGDVSGTLTLGTLEGEIWALKEWKAVRWRVRKGDVYGTETQET